ncbi:hypothetical protein ACFCYH_15380 [Streptomyces sp. NPDC056400]|uniref:hypothetical protein n=1 Tax=Streptomyces sp. NPDC056400 TaxID=3345808 RepID=UPI0035E30772
MDGSKAVHWYRMSAKAADASEDLDTRVWVRGCAEIALVHEGAALPIADLITDQAIALSNNRPSLGLLNAVFGKAHTYALRGGHPTTRTLLAEGRRIYAIMTAFPTEVAP